MWVKTSFDSAVSECNWPVSYSHISGDIEGSALQSKAGTDKHSLPPIRITPGTLDAVDRVDCFRNGP